MKQKFIKTLFFFTVLLLGLLLYSHIIIEKTVENKIYNNLNDIPKNKVGLVLGTVKYLPDGRQNFYFFSRVNAAVSLFKNNKIDYILISGDNSRKDYDEPTDFKNELIKRGIPKNKIYLDFAGFRTLDSILRAKEVFGLTTFTIISQEFHNKRAIYLATKHGIDAIGFNATDLTGRYSYKTKLREVFAKAKAVLDIIINVQPKFFGKKIIIK
jgi:SanA protein